MNPGTQGSGKKPTKHNPAGQKGKKAKRGRQWLPKQAQTHTHTYTKYSHRMAASNSAVAIPVEGRSSYVDRLFKLSIYANARWHNNDKRARLVTHRLFIYACECRPPFRPVCPVCSRWPIFIPPCTTRGHKTSGVEPFVVSLSLSL